MLTRADKADWLLDWVVRMMTAVHDSVCPAMCRVTKDFLADFCALTDWVITDTLCKLTE